MTKIHRKLVLACAAALVVAFILGAGGQEVKKFTLFAGVDTDSTEQASIWIPVKGATKVIIRTWSTHLAFGGNADSAKSDSLASFSVLLSDSVSFIARDSLGTIVTARSGWTLLPVTGQFPMCADSVVIPLTATGDTTASWTRVYGAPINKALRGAQNGSGLISVVTPVTQWGTTTLPDGGRAIIAKEYLRVRTIPVRRNTANGTTSTQGLRVNGLRGLKMEAFIYTDNK